jgi:hypothetical protein
MILALGSLTVLTAPVCATEIVSAALAKEIALAALKLRTKKKPYTLLFSL